MTAPTSRLDTDAEYRRKVEERLWSQVERRSPSECWAWTGQVLRSGYASLRIACVGQTASRVMCWLVYGPPPERGFRWHASHTCHNKKCLNPGHVIWEEQGVNVGRNTLARRGPKPSNSRRWLARTTAHEVRRIWSSLVTRPDIWLPCRDERRVHSFAGEAGSSPEAQAARVAALAARCEQLEAAGDRVDTRRFHGRLDGCSLFNDAMPISRRAWAEAHPRPLKRDCLPVMPRWVWCLWRGSAARYMFEPHPWLSASVQSFAKIPS